MIRPQSLLKPADAHAYWENNSAPNILNDVQINIQLTFFLKAKRNNEKF